MKIILWMAISLNGMIADKNGNEDFLSHQNWIEFVKFANKVGCLIWGRNTYELVKNWEKSYLDDLANVKKVIISRNKSLALDPEFTLAENPKQALKILEEKGFKEVVLTGGSINNTSFAKENLIDEIILDIEPVIIGKGIRLFKEEEFQLNLKLIDVIQLNSDIIQLHYKVKK